MLSLKLCEEKQQLDKFYFLKIEKIFWTQNNKIVKYFYKCKNYT